MVPSQRSPLESFDQEVAAQTVALAVLSYGQPSEESHADVIVRQTSSMASRQVVMVDAAHRERVIPEHLIGVINEEEGARQVAALILEGMDREPIVKGLHAAMKGAQLVVPNEPFDPHQSMRFMAVSARSWRRRIGHMSTRARAVNPLPDSSYPSRSRTGFAASGEWCRWRASGHPVRILAGLALLTLDFDRQRRARQAGFRHVFPVQGDVSSRDPFYLVNTELYVLSDEPLTRRVK